jgi:hypothetical protein
MRDARHQSSVMRDSKEVSLRLSEDISRYSMMTECGTTVSRTFYGTSFATATCVGDVSLSIKRLKRESQSCEAEFSLVETLVETLIDYEFFYENFFKFFCTVFVMVNAGKLVETLVGTIVLNSRRNSRT